MAFPTTGVLDAFTDTNGVDLPAHSASWVAPPAGAANLEVQSNQATGTTAGYCLNYRSTNYGPSSEAYVTVVTPPATSGIATVGVRYANETSFATLDGYNLTLTVAAGTDTLAIQRIDNGVSTTLGAAISQEVSAGDAIGLFANGSTLQAYYKASGGSWGQAGTDRTDSTYSAAGKIALLCTGTTVRFDDFGGGTTIQQVAIGQATETDTAQAVSKTKALTAGEASETDAVQPVTARKTLLMPQVVETDMTQPMTVGGAQVITIGQATETDAAQSVTGSKTVAIGQASETSTAQVFSITKARAAAQAEEMDAAQATGRLKAAQIGQAAETDFAQPMTVVGHLIVAIGQASEADSAAAVVRLKTVVITAVAETDFASNVIPFKTKAVVAGEEIDLAQPVTSSGGSAPTAANSEWYITMRRRRRPVPLMRAGASTFRA
jgi:hypothetical protein